ncbi:hypothetical protein BGZ81_006986 [Podila clonocystis]|nr:hypothetical protein BGZ81_006986 [Podila clonocystis]
MDIGPRYEIVFLSELHDRIRNGHLQDGSGFFRIIGRLADYDIYTQIAKVQSCFHHQYPPNMPPTDDVPEEAPPPPPPTSTDTIDLISSESEAEQEDITMFTPLKKPTSNGSLVESNTTSSSTTPRHEGVIDLTSDVEDEVDEIVYTQPGEMSSWGTPEPPRSRGKSVRLSLDLKDKQHTEPRTMDQDRHSHLSIDKGKQRAEPRYRDQGLQAPRSTDLKGKQRKSENVDQDRQAQLSVDMDGEEHESQEDQTSQPPKVPKPPQTAPMVQLSVDTQLLGPRMYEPRSLFEFSGQVVFDPTLEDDSNCLSVGSEAGNERGPGRWVMLAKSARNMEGLDLYAYRESVLKIRELMPEYNTGNIDQWLAKHFHAQGQEAPVFERNHETAQFVRELMELNQAQDRAAQQTLNALEQCTAVYRDEDIKLTEVIQAFGITKDQLAPDTQASLSHLAELGMLLNLSDLTLPSFQQAFSLLRLDTLDPYTLLMHETQVALVDTHLARAEDELRELVQLRDTLARERDTVHDMEIRNKRRSVELMKREFQQKTQEEQNLVQVPGGGGDVEAQGLTVSQIKSQEAVVVGLQDQLDVQSKNLAAYKEIPPDYTLAMLKLNEANARLEQLSSEHEAMVQRLADDLLSIQDAVASKESEKSTTGKGMGYFNNMSQMNEPSTDAESSPQSSETQGVNFRNGQQHHRNRSSNHIDDCPGPASSPSEPSSSVPSYSLHRSRSPDSPPVRTGIHIGQDSEFLNNWGFTSSYEPTELLGHRSHVHHSHARDFHGFDEMDYQVMGGFRSASPKPVLHQEPEQEQTEEGALQPEETEQKPSQPQQLQIHDLRHQSSQGQLSRPQIQAFWAVRPRGVLATGVVAKTESLAELPPRSCGPLGE